MNSPRWQNLVSAVRKLPGVGPKMAERLALFLMRSDQTESILRAIVEAKKNLQRCSLCGIFTESELCDLCSDPRRERQELCVIEEMADLEAMERSGAFRGVYHLLDGALSPLDGVGPQQLRIESLIQRIKTSSPRIEEIILATNPTVEGEATATYLIQLIQSLDVKISRLAYGLPSGVSLEYADELTLSRALEGRKEIQFVR